MEGSLQDAAVVVTAGRGNACFGVERNVTTDTPRGHAQPIAASFNCQFKVYSRGKKGSVVAEHVRGTAVKSLRTGQHQDKHCGINVGVSQQAGSAYAQHGVAPV